MATDKFRNIKAQIKVTPNILSRVAIMLALKDGSALANIGFMESDASVEDSTRQIIDKSVMFGEYVDTYEVLIKQFMHDHKIARPVEEVVVSLIDAGVHKMGHIKRLEDLCRVSL